MSIINKKKNNITTIRVKKETIKLLRHFAIYPRETNEDILIRLMDKYKK